MQYNMKENKFQRTRGGESKNISTLLKNASDSQMFFATKNISEGNLRSDQKCVHIGLDNLGNTCYMNAILQCLRSTECFNQYCSTKEFGALKKGSKTCGCLYPALANVIDVLNGNSNEEVPSNAIRKFKTVFSKMVPSYSGSRQQDALEFFTYLVNGLYEETNNATNPIPIKSRRSKLSGRISRVSQDKPISPPSYQSDTRLIHSCDVLPTLSVNLEKSGFQSSSYLGNDTFSSSVSPDSSERLRISTKARLLQWLSRRTNPDRLATSFENGASPIKETSDSHSTQSNFLESIFSGHFRTRITCKNCKHTTSHKERFWNLALCIPESKQVEDSVPADEIFGKNFVKLKQTATPIYISNETKEADVERARIHRKCGTFIPPDYNSIKNGEKQERAETKRRTYSTVNYVSAMKAIDDGTKSGKYRVMSCRDFGAQFESNSRAETDSQTVKSSTAVGYCSNCDSTAPKDLEEERLRKKYSSADFTSCRLLSTRVSVNMKEEPANNYSEMNLRDCCSKQAPEKENSNENRTKKCQDVYSGPCSNFTSRCSVDADNSQKLMKTQVSTDTSPCDDSRTLFPSPIEIGQSEPIHTGISLIDCLNTFTKIEELDGDDRPCEFCKENASAEFQILISDLPEILVLQFQRFDSCSSRTKRRNLIKFDFELDMRTFTTEQQSENEDPEPSACGLRRSSSTPYLPTIASPVNKKSTTRRYFSKSKKISTSLSSKSPLVEVNRNTKYRLYAVVYHYGSTDRGHYTARTLLPNPNGDGYGWYHFDDDRVEKITDLSEIVHQSACILFYQRLPNVQSSQSMVNFESCISSPEDNSSDVFRA